MQIQINTDRNIEAHQAIAAQVNGVVDSALSGRVMSDTTASLPERSAEPGSSKMANGERGIKQARLEPATAWWPGRS
jgi:hypothetical protein